MMDSKYVRVLLLALLSVSCSRLLLCSGLDERIIYVAPSSSLNPFRRDFNISCPIEPCLTLSQYVQEAEQYFVSNTAFIFLPGDHILDREVHIQGVTDLSFVGVPSLMDSRVRIKCTSAVSIVFSDVVNINIFALTFSSCGNATQYGALIVRRAQNFQLVNSTMQHIPVSALRVRDSSLVLTHNSFTNNIAIYEECLNTPSFALCAGAGMLIVNSLVFITGTHVFINNTAIHGGAFYAINSNVILIGTNLFDDNTAHFGGASQISNSVLTLNGINNFTSNQATHGGGFVVLESRVSFNGLSSFVNNSVLDSSAVAYVESSSVDFNGSTVFLNNHAPDRGGVALFHSNVSFVGETKFIGNLLAGALYAGSRSEVTLDGTTLFANNSSPLVAGALIAESSHLLFTGETTFLNNSAAVAGAAFLTGSSTAFSGSTTFILNFGSAAAGGLDAFNSSVNFTGRTSFVNNSVQYAGGAGMLVSDGTIVNFNGETNFSSNSAGLGGGIYTLRATVHFNEDVSFAGNTAHTYHGGAIYAAVSEVNFYQSSQFTYNGAQSFGGAIQAESTTVSFSGSSSFLRNSANHGGAISLEFNSMLYFLPPLEIIFEQNSAARGGAVYVTDAATSVQCSDDTLLQVDPSLNQCFFQIAVSEPTPSEESLMEIELVFINNSASTGGPVLYGGMLDRCQFIDVSLNQYTAIDIFRNLSSISPESSQLNPVTSDPIHVCFCIEGNPECESLYFNVSARRGQTFQVSVVAVDQLKEGVPAIIRNYVSSATSSDAEIGTRIQETERTCTNLSYSVLSSNENENVVLFAEGPCRDIGIAQRLINLTFLPCPIGFILSNSQCVCEDRLQKFTNSCNVEDGTVTRAGKFWMSALVFNESYTGLLIHPNCPFDYCLEGTIDVSLSIPNALCAFSRSGILCGSCELGLSLALGTTRCMQCTNNYLALLVAFGVAGIVLVALLILLKLTVAVGTISGLIFYANIIAVNQSIFLPRGTVNSLTVFVAWLNLDLGIESCFFDGMDAYYKAWLQFVFPLYIWSLIISIMILSQHSTILSRILGTNPVSVLATLFLLSYTKILRTIITAMSFTVLDYPDRTESVVWLYDGNIRFLTGKHIPLFLAAVLALLLLYVPYTAVLLVGQWIQSRSNGKPFRWFSDLRIRAFMDAYYAPYKDSHRYWPGFLLLLRSVLFLVFAFNALGDPSVNLLAISTGCLGLAILNRFTGGVYRNVYLDVLESSFILNLGILAAATYHVTQTGGNQTALAFTSIAIAFSTFLGVVIYHIYLQLQDDWKRIWRAIFFKFHRQEQKECEEESEHYKGDDEPEAEREESRRYTCTAPQTTVVTVELREPLELIETQ